MKAGRELDALIAEKVMGWELSTNGEVWIDKSSGECIRDVDDFRPSDPDGIVDAMLVVEKISFRHELTIGAFVLKCWGWLGRCWEAGWINPYPNDFTVKADTAPLAICLAALKAIE